MAIGDACFTDVSEEMLEVLEPFTNTNPETTITRYLEFYSSDAVSEEVLEAHRTLVGEGEEDGIAAVDTMTDGVFSDAIQSGYIETTGEQQQVLQEDGAAVATVRLTLDGWQVLEAANTVTLTRWDDTVELELVEGDSWKTYFLDEETVEYDTIDIPRQVPINVLFEGGIPTIEPCDGTAVVYERNPQAAAIIGVE